MIRYRDLKIEDARLCARDLLRRCAVVSPGQMDPVQLAAHLGVTVKAGRLVGMDYKLIRARDHVTLLISERVSPMVRRFMIAHELGHLLLEHPPRSSEKIQRQQIVRVPLAEMEANAFASELLMPGAFVREVCNLARGDLEGPREISRVFEISLLAGAIRYTELTRESVAAVFCRNGKVQWAVPSAAMELLVRRGRVLSPSSLASSFFATSEPPTEPTQVPDAAWFDGPSFGRVIEHVACAPALRTTLSMVWIQRDVV